MTNGVWCLAAAVAVAAGTAAAVEPPRAAVEAWTSGAPVTALRLAVRHNEGSSAQDVDSLPSWMPRIEAHLHCSQRISSALPTHHEQGLASHPCIAQLPTEVALFRSVPPSRLLFRVIRLAGGGLAGPSPGLGHVVSALKDLAPGASGRATTRTSSEALLRVSAELSIVQYGENIGLVMAVASAVASHGPTGGTKKSTTRTLHPGLLARAVAREAPDVLDAGDEDGFVLPVLLVDEELAPSLETGQLADWGLAHSGQASGDAGDRPAAVVVAIVRRGAAGTEVLDADAVAEAAGAVLRTVGALPPPGGVITGATGGAWASRAWGRAVHSVGEAPAAALVWPAVLVRALAAARTQAAAAILRRCAAGPENSALLRTSLWSGLARRWAAVARLSRRVEALGDEALGYAAGGGAAGSGGLGALVRFRAAASHLLRESDATFYAAAAVAVAADHSTHGCGAWEETAGPAGAAAAEARSALAWAGIVACSAAAAGLGGAALRLALKWRDRLSTAARLGPRKRV